MPPYLSIRLEIVFCQRTNSSSNSCAVGFVRRSRSVNLNAQTAAGCGGYGLDRLAFLCVELLEQPLLAHVEGAAGLAVVCCPLRAVVEAPVVSDSEL
jgi:hypothetical protein